jgi:hypothetical protein
MTEYNDNLLTPPPSKPEGVSRLAFIATLAAVLLVGLVVGTILGVAGASGAHSEAQPQPTKTVTVEVPAAVEVNPCQDVAVDLMAMLKSMNSDVAMPQNDVIQITLDMLSTGDYSRVVEATTKMNGVTESTHQLTDRLSALQPDYARCVNP